MTSERPFNPSSVDNDPSELHRNEEDESSVALLLADALDAPPVPRSLTKRLDAEITEQWGHSPGLTGSRATGTVTLAGAKRVIKTSWWLAGTVAASLMLIVFLAGGSNTYAWATVLEAMQQHGLIQIADADGNRWLDLSKRIACEQTPQQTRWVDVDRRMVSISSGQAETRTSSLAIPTNVSPTNEELLAMMLLGQPLTAQSIEQFRGVRIVHQDWQKRSDSGRTRVDLEVEFATQDDQRFELSLELDSESKLPQSVNLGSHQPDRLQPSSLTYLNESTTELQSRLMLAKVDAKEAANAPSPERTATSDRANTDQPERAKNPPSEGGDHSPQPVGNTSESVVALPIGPANKWQPVAVVPRASEQVISRVDAILDELWQERQIRPVDRATDLQLLRRVHLDLAGRTPTVTEVRRFLKNNSDDRYQELVDHLLDTPDYTSQMAAVWRSFLIPEGVDLEAFGGREAFEKWLAEQFADDEPYDRIVRRLLLAEGRLAQSGPLLFYTALKLDADQLAARTSRVFLGMRLECAQCHDHPFEPWSQEDFWSYAAFFAQISRPKAMLENVSTVMQVRDVDRGEVMLPESEQVISPRFLGQEWETADEKQPPAPRRQRLATWLTGPDNPYFARATVNRVWSHMFGRGIVDPVDDFGENNLPVSAELLDTLASQFIDSDFDLKQLVRSIALTRAYQLSSSSNRDDDSSDDIEERLTTFAQMNVKTLTPEQVYDCIAVATLLNQQNAESDYTLARFGNNQRDTFLQQFAAPATSRSEYLAGIPQALMLMNGSLIAQATHEQSSGLIRSLDAPFFTDEQRIEVLFLSTLSRPPRSNERELVAEFLPADASREQRHTGLADLLWALINSSEFTLNH
ncbi:DUF1549 and DUF1553 domain-containing protein [Rhodopirellula sp. P2]|uniref:DUF1549 and DUF1553 domain-containing protein n=1 Tax=Rhodopirellula sp. P2 TaxID=2127060 RepID=UPI002367A3B6|nr:DUF1549 and DUF1553 domain-containing protein [Rhodopirellula sp. P2]WDQ16281.1 DUF1549 and DUF1553 domain-containing protein [Rhodopirellula sp. P2]